MLEGKHREAFELFLQHANDGDDDSLTQVAWMSLCGLGTSQDPGKAYVYLSRIKVLQPTSSSILGLCYFHGVGCLKNHDKAKQLISKNLHFCGCDFLYFILSYLYECVDAPIDTIYIYACANVAASLNSTEAVAFRDKLATLMSKVDVDKAQAFSEAMLDERNAAVVTC